MTVGYFLYCYTCHVNVIKDRTEKNGTNYNISEPVVVLLSRSCHKILRAIKSSTNRTGLPREIRE